MADQAPDPRVALLLTERQGHLNTGDDDGVKQAEQRLRDLGYDTEGQPLKQSAAERRAASTSPSEPPKGRTSQAAGAGQTTTEGGKKA